MKDEALYSKRLSTIVALFRQSEPPPSIEEMRRAIGVESKDSVRLFLRQMEEDGYIKKGPFGKVRAITLTEKGKRIAPLVVLAEQKNGVLWRKK